MIQITGVKVPFSKAAFQRVCSQHNLAALDAWAKHICSMLRSVMQHCPGVMSAMQSWSRSFQLQLQQRLPQLSDAASSAMQICKVQLSSRILGRQVSHPCAYCTLSASDWLTTAVSRPVSFHVWIWTQVKLIELFDCFDVQTLQPTNQKSVVFISHHEVMS